jgi:hypothetical protein
MTKPNMERPKKLHSPDFSELIKICEEYLDHLESDDICEDTASDMDHLIMEAALDAIYGSSIDGYHDYMVEKSYPVNEDYCAHCGNKFIACMSIYGKKVNGSVYDFCSEKCRNEFK